MKKTFVTKIPDKAGAFLSASKIISSNGVNITRVSYNKAIDLHTLFIDVSGEEEAVEKSAKQLEKLGYLSFNGSNENVLLLEFTLPDVVGSVTPVLEIINDYNLNITYISSQENGSPYQYFKMGLHVDSTSDVKSFLDRVSKICRIKVIDYDSTEKTLDNTVFYLSFADGIIKKLSLPDSSANELITQSNLIMQQLDELGKSPYKTFGYIGKFAELLFENKGAGFDFRLTETDCNGFIVYSIEPGCGCNVYFFRVGDQLVFVDGGYTCYEKEIMQVVRSVYQDAYQTKKVMLLTHSDTDHCGVNAPFDEIYLSEASAKDFYNEQSGAITLRESNSAHFPYCRITKILTCYRSPDLNKLRIIGKKPSDRTDNYSLIGKLNFGELSFECYQGNGGHIDGETVFVERTRKIAFTGDIEVNVSGYTEKQKKFNKLAPYLMRSVNMDSQKAKAERLALKTFLGDGYTIFGGHGAPFSYGPKDSK